MTRPRLSDMQPPRDRWRVEMVEQKVEGGLVLFEYAIREPLKDPFLLNNHRAQIRTNHQRVVTGPNGGLMHVSGIEVTDVRDFMAASVEAYRWVDRDRFGRWRDDRGRVLAPFLFPAAAWAGGQMEELDPQWQREAFTIPLASQITECIDRYQTRMAIKGYVGDRRGTTLNLQVGASADDAIQNDLNSVFITSTSIFSDSVAEHAGFRFVATIPSGATIDNAIFSVAIVGTTDSDEPFHRLQGQAIDDAPQFTAGSYNNNIDSRTRTTALVDWNVADLGNTADGTFTEWGSASIGASGLTIEAIIQEVIDRAGWASGQGLVLIYQQISEDANRDLSVKSYDANTTLAAKLDIDYTAGGGTAVKDIIGGGFIPFAR